MSHRSRRWCSSRVPASRSERGGLGQALVEDGDRLRPMRAGDDVLALRVEQDVAVQHGLAGRGVARERDAGRRVGAAVAEHHRLDGDRGAQVVGDALAPAVRDGAVAVPGAEHGLDGQPQLLPRVVGHGLDADDRREHRLQAVAARRRERRVAGDRGQALGRGGGQAEVEDRVHHPGHRHRRAGADADQQRVGRVAEPAARRRLDLGHPLAGARRRGRRASREARTSRQVAGGDREARRHRQPQVRPEHPGEVRRLAADERPDLVRVELERVVELVRPPHRPASAGSAASASSASSPAGPARPVPATAAGRG